MKDSQRTRGVIRDAVLIAGPTGSGKSALALEIARREGRVIVNADSMQVYDVLRVLTARPSDADLSDVPHHLYGHVSPDAAYSVGRWVEDVKRVASQGVFDAAPPVFVGGTGLYFHALCRGLAEIPQIPSETREVWRRRLIAEGAEALHEVLRGKDPAAGAAIRPTDGQRVVRALEVHDATGKSLLHWQAGVATPLVDAASATRIVLDADRDSLNRRIDERFNAMVEAGAIEEVRRLREMALPADAAATKAIGVPQLSRFLDGEFSLEEAVRDAKVASRQYAKRQATWFRHQLGEGWERRRVC